MAYADGELDAQARRDIEAAIDADPELALRVARHRALRDELQAAFGGVLDERIPERLLQAANSQPAAAKVADLSAARTVRAGRTLRRWSWPQYVSIAASLLVGVMIGRVMLQSPSSTLIVADKHGLIAGNAVATALSNQAGGTATSSGMQIGLSFRNKAGEYCRTFTAETSTLTGVACHAADHWRIQALAQNSSSSGDYRMANTALPLPILKAIEDTIEGEPLDAQAEAAARARDWKD
jgi:hypothetical protein